MRNALLPGLAALLAACAVGPDYKAPETEATPFGAAQAAAVSEQPFEAAWWEQFQDPVLDGLIERALTDDLDLKIALARVEESRAILSAARRDRLTVIRTTLPYRISELLKPAH